MESWVRDKSRATTVRVKSRVKIEVKVEVKAKVKIVV